MANDDVYEASPYSPDRDENRRNRITEVEKDIEKAYEFMDGPGGDMAREIARQTIAMDDMDAGAASFITDLKRKAKSWSRVNGERLMINDHVAIVLRRLLCAEIPEFVDYAALSSAQCDEILYASDPERFSFLIDVYGAAPTNNAKP